MADVRPFPGLRFHVPATELAAVVTPPYDVITPTAQANYYARHPHNIIRLELGQDEPDDDALDNRYTRAAATFAEWRLTGDLCQDPPTLYVYQQQFAVGDATYTRTSLLGRVRLEPWDAGVILPHERTLAKPKDDRLRLLRACTANLSPLMVLYDDPDHAVAALTAAVTTAEPAVDFTDEQQERHVLWLVTDPALQAQITAAFAGRQLFMADGHHRYETALAFRDEVREARRELAPDDAANFALMALIATDDPGLVVLPTHRLVRNLDAPTVANIPERLSRFWEVEPLDPAEGPSLTAQLAELQATGVTAAIVATRKHQWLVRLRPEAQDRLQATGETEAWQKLDIAAVHELIVDEALGIPRDVVATSDQISYTRSAEEALVALTSGAAQVAILLNPTLPTQVRDVAQAGGRMPQKSTYFYPKLITGLVINPVW